MDIGGATDVSLGTIGRPAGPSVERWLEEHVWLVAIVITAIGMLLRVITAATTYLNPDEALHVAFSDQSSLIAAYRSSLRNSDPPMLCLLLFLMRQLGTSDFVLRLPSLLAGTATMWIGFKWLSDSFGKAAGLAGLVLLAFSPMLTYANAEIRAYSILIFFMVAGLRFLGLALRDNSPLMMALFGIMLVLAVLTQYSAALFALVVGTLVLFRLVRGWLPARLAYVWAGGQVVTAVLAATLLLRHVEWLRSTDWWSNMTSTWLSQSFYNPGERGVLTFVLQQSKAVLNYLTSSWNPGSADAMILFAAGVALLIVRRQRGQPEHLSSDGTPTEDAAPVVRDRPGSMAGHELGLLLVLPFVIACGAGVAGLYPYGGSHHSLFLSVFALGSLGVLGAKVAGNRLWLILAASLLLVPLWLAKGTVWAPGWHRDPNNEKRDLMVGAMDYIRKLTPPTGLVFTDIQSGAEARHYLYGEKRGGSQIFRAGFNAFQYNNGYRLVTTKSWSFIPATFGDDLFHMAEQHGLTKGEPVTVFSAGWSSPVSYQLKYALNITYPDLRNFGGCMSVFVVPVGTEVKSESLTDVVERTGRVIDSLVRNVAAKGYGRMGSVLLPAYYLDSIRRERLVTLAPRVISFAGFSDSVSSGRMTPEDLLPALAFRVFGSQEPKLELLSYMDERESYRSAGYRFTLLETDPDTVAGVYLVESSVLEGLDLLVRRSRSAAQRCTSAFWPGEYLAAVGTVASRPHRRTIGYGALKLLLEDRPLEDFLPALALWRIGSLEDCTAYMRYMNGLASFRAAGYRFDLLDVDPDSAVAAYRIEMFDNPAIPAFAGALIEKLEHRPKTLFVPDRQKGAVARQISEVFSGQPLGYRELYRIISSGKGTFDDYPPALAMWEFGSRAEHPEFMGFMDDRESYVSGGYAFAFLGVTDDGAVGAYLIEPADSVPSD